MLQFFYAGDFQNISQIPVIYVAAIHVILDLFQKVEMLCFSVHVQI
jgi:hypothetical protein